MNYTYCLLTNTINPRILDYESKLPGIFQWVKAFRGTLRHARSILTLNEELDADIVHVSLLPENIGIGTVVKENKILKKTAKLVGCLDLYALLAAGGTPDRFIATHTDDLQSYDLIHIPFSSCTNLSADIASFGIHLIPHPSNTSGLEVYRAGMRNPGKSYFVFIHRDGIDYPGISRHVRKTFGRKTILLLGSQETDSGRNFSSFDRIVNPATFEELMEIFRDTFMLVDISPLPVFGKYVLLAAELGIPVVGSQAVEGMETCYPYTIVDSDSIEGAIKHIEAMCMNPLFYTKVTAQAIQGIAGYGYARSVERLTSILHSAPRTKKEIACTETRRAFSLDTMHRHTINNGRIPVLRFGEHIKHLFGRESVAYRVDECSVVCLVRNGAFYMDRFIDHYKKLGIVHFYFIDNNSTDRTLELIRRYDMTTAYTTPLPFKEYECEIRRAAVTYCIRNRWCLAVDIDEHFDYPFSDRVPLRRFLSYLTDSGFTAVVAYMLDMFSREPIYRKAKATDPVFRESDYPFYDLSDFHWEEYPKDFAKCRRNTVTDAGVRNCLGGIRKRLFGSSAAYCLTKHPLIFMDEKIVPFTHPHFPDNATIADVTAVLKHYKLVASFFGQLNTILKEKNYPKSMQDEYELYNDSIGDRDFFTVIANNPREWTSVDALIEGQYCYVSKKYEDFAGK